MQSSLSIRYWYLDKSSALTANLDFSSAATRRTMTATTASGTGRIVSEHDGAGGETFSQSSPLPVANRTIPVASRITIEASVGAHTPRPNSYPILI